MAGYETLLARGLIKPFKAEPSQIEAQLRLARRDLKAAAEMLDKVLDWAFNIAYKAVLQATRGLIYSEGYRLSGGEGNHKAAIQFAEMALGNDLKTEVRFFDRMRIKRNQAVYDTAGIISRREAEQAIKFSELLVEIISDFLKK
ncbi:MAG: HEPN domain-containing protein [Syntrophaceae bacterium]